MTRKPHLALVRDAKRPRTLWTAIEVVAALVLFGILMVFVLPTSPVLLTLLQRLW